MRKWYWVAVNGASASGRVIFPSAEPPGCFPTPEQLLGFETREEAKSHGRYPAPDPKPTG
jgi:hypothetical protein